MFCGECGTRNTDGVKFCIKCGAKMAGITPASAQPDKPVAPQTAPVPAPAPAQVPAQPPAEKKNPCPNCGLDNPDNSDTCTECGALFFRKCPLCGHINKANKKYCDSCGNNTQQKINCAESMAKAKEYEKQRKFNEAIMEYESILTVEPGNSEAKRSLGKLQETMQNVAKMRQTADKCFKEDRFEEAREIYNQIIRLGPADESIYKIVEEIPKLLFERNNKQKIAAIKEAIEKQNYLLAMDEAKKLLEADPASEFASNIIHEIETKQANLDSLNDVKADAMHELKKSVIILAVIFLVVLGFSTITSCNNNQNQIRSAKLLIKKNKYPEAVRHLELCGSLGISSKEKDDLLKQAVEGACPKWAESARVKLNQRDFKGALEDLNKALRYRPNDLELLKMKTGLSPTEGLIFLAANEQGQPEFLHEQTGMTFVQVPGGKFVMGNDDSADGLRAHDVAIRDFLISKYEVTQGAWTRIMSANPSNFKNGIDYPVEKISWNDCREFCRKTGLRLPTEAEWEYVCRGGSQTLFYWGDREDNNYLWCDSNSGGASHPVGHKRPNAWGIFDMSGNVCEWCQDWYDANYYAASPAENPPGPASGKYRVIRGGSWNDKARDSSSHYRYWINPSEANNFVGFRCAKDIK